MISAIRFSVLKKLMPAEVHTDMQPGGGEYPQPGRLPNRYPFRSSMIDGVSDLMKSAPSARSASAENELVMPQQ